jgi:hypothetical protein
MAMFLVVTLVVIVACLTIFLRMKKLRSEGVKTQGTITRLFSRVERRQSKSGSMKKIIKYKMHYIFSDRTGNEYMKDLSIKRDEYVRLGGTDFGIVVDDDVTVRAMGVALSASKASPEEEIAVNHPIEIVYLENNPSLNMPVSRVSSSGTSALIFMGVYLFFAALVAYYLIIRT